MSLTPGSLWKKLASFDADLLADNKNQLHQAIQNVAAVGRTFLPYSEGDEAATLIWDSDLSRLVGRWVQGGIKFRSSFHPETFTVHLVDASVTSMASTSLADKKQGIVMVWLEEQLIQLQLNTKTLSLDRPYELPEYPQAKGKPFTPNTEAQVYLTSLYHNAWLVLEQVMEVKQGFGELAIWPHHFDAGSLQIVKDTGDRETSASVGIGMSPGDEHFDQPYFYVNVWPYPSIETFDPLPYGEWYDEEWVGATLMMSDVITADTASAQHRMVYGFLDTAIDILKSTIK